MNLTYKRATLEDIDILTETRIEVLRAANKLSADTDMSEVERQSYNYYQKALCDSSHIAYLVFDENRFVGAGGVSFFQVMPTYHNPTVAASREKSKGSSCFGFFRSLFNMVERMSPPKYTAITSRSKTAISLINIIRTLIFFVSFL